MAFGFKILDGDFVIESKKLTQVINNDKLLRDFRKFLITDAETENNLTSYYRYNSKYGTTLNNRALYNGLPNSSILDLLNQNLSSALKYYISLQESRNNLSLGEMIANIEFMTYVNITDKRKIDINIKIQVPNNNVLNVGTFTQTVA